MTTTFSVPEIHCDHCRAAPEGALAPQPGVARVEVDLGSKLVTVEHAEGTDVGRLATAIERPGLRGGRHGERSLMATAPTATPAKAGKAERDEDRELELAVEGMHCASCAGRIQRVLARQPGVSEATVNFATQRAHLLYDPEQAPLEELEGAVEGIAPRLSPPRPPA